MSHQLSDAEPLPPGVYVSRTIDSDSIPTPPVVGRASVKPLGQMVVDAAEATGDARLVETARGIAAGGRMLDARQFLDALDNPQPAPSRPGNGGGYAAIRTPKPPQPAKHLRNPF